MTSSMDSDRTYQIFEREPNNTTVCVEVVKGIQEARRRIEKARTEAQGSEHFVFDPLAEKTIDPDELSSTTDPLTPCRLSTDHRKYRKHRIVGRNGTS